MRSDERTLKNRHMVSISHFHIEKMIHINTKVLQNEEIVINRHKWKGKEYNIMSANMGSRLTNENEINTFLLDL